MDRAPVGEGRGGDGWIGRVSIQHEREVRNERIEPRSGGGVSVLGLGHEEERSIGGGVVGSPRDIGLPTQVQPNRGIRLTPDHLRQ